ncbi:MAG TPA: tRNA preQ1(34) S-adenosylmethionine ribosyltransferase-isomerase QueA [Deinococcales bacterium]|nr:tRNA preQ1(34) S-adenosylmethionine ribosyltransferase-isomerase QueA [Deinococcales bacterium]
MTGPDSLDPARAWPLASREPRGQDIEDYGYTLPEDRIAQSGAEPRDSSRLMVVQRGRGVVAERHFFNLTDHLRPGDVLVTNTSRVIPARLEATRPSGGKVEVLLLREEAPRRWTAYLRPARRTRPGSLLEFPAGVSATVAGVLDDGARLLEFSEDIKPKLHDIGAVPLPPYIHAQVPEERYQTVYAREDGSVAAPTAGLHFTQELLARLREGGVEFAPVVLHVGAGTFRPVTTDIEHHVMHAERFEVPETTAGAVNRAKAEGRRVIAVGTTVVRAVESAWREGEGLRAGAGETRLFIRPGYRYRVPDALITNFHLPRSTLLMLVAAYAGFDAMRSAYLRALAGGYRFYSLGDAMLIGDFPAEGA